jgi:ABC-2 type transport system permease protein
VTTQALRRPGFFQHVLLLWWLRAAIGLNKGKTPNHALALASFLFSSAPALGLGATFYGVLQYGPIARSGMWPPFILNLLCFCSAAVWCTWPILSAGVDDHSELTRYAAFPISGVRLLFASSIASLFEPRSIVIYSPVVGAALGYAHLYRPESWLVLGLLFALYLILNAAWGRVGLHIVLNVLRQKRSAELIGGFFVVVLTACSFIPPIDASWLQNVGKQGIQALNMDLIGNAAHALARVPPGFFGAGVELLGAHRVFPALMRGVGMAAFALVGYAGAYRLLLAFHRGAGRAGPSGSERAERNAFASTNSRLSTLIVREALDLWKNPKARLLASVPFLLAILLKLISGRDLIVFFAGRTADGWLLGFLCLYGAVVMGSTFSQNMFAYDGHGMAVFLAAPMRLDEVMRAKNVVHGAAAILIALAVSAFYAVYFRTASWADWVCATAAVLAIVPVLLAAGNFLSLYFPVKFHATLKRRDRLPFAASMLGVAAASWGSAPFVLSLRADGRGGASWPSALTIAGCAVLAWVIYRALLPLALRQLEARREIVLRAVTRE